jgi:dihydrodipicolinate synthase/N-acetylneuraminate lyase
MPTLEPSVRAALQRGVVIPACPLALNAQRKLDEQRQRALLRYYVAAGAGGIAVGVHTTQFAIREAGLFAPLLNIAHDELLRIAPNHFIRIGGICGKTPQALAEAELLRAAGYHCGLLSLGALRNASETELLQHAREISRVIPIIGFYLQPSVGGRVLLYSFWRRFAEIENVVAVKIAPFNRYQTLDVIRAIAESGREEIALYTGNDDNILLDLVTPFRFEVLGKLVERRIVGGLLGHWAVWTRRAVELLARCHELRNAPIPQDLVTLAAQITDANAAFFDAGNGFHGCIPGIHEVLRRQGLLEGTWCLDPAESLSPGQPDEIERVWRAYPHLNDDAFVSENLTKWLR